MASERAFFSFSFLSLFFRAVVARVDVPIRLGGDSFIMAHVDIIIRPVKIECVPIDVPIQPVLFHCRVVIVGVVAVVI